jgi:hypothetical protein
MNGQAFQEGLYFKLRHYPFYASVSFKLPMCYNKKRKEAIYMRCEYNDGFKVDYTGSLNITKGDDINFSVRASFIPDNVKSELATAAAHNSCSELRQAAQKATNAIGGAFSQ